MHHSTKILLEIFLGVILTILVTQLIIPRFFKSQTKYFTIDDSYLNIYVSFLIALFQIGLLFLGVLFFT